MQVSMTQSFAHDGVANTENNDGERQERDHDVAGVPGHRLSTKQRTRSRRLNAGTISSGTLRTIDPLQLAVRYRTRLNSHSRTFLPEQSAHSLRRLSPA